MTDLDTMSEMWDLAASTHERPKTELDRAYDTLRAGWKTLPAFRHEFAQSLLRASFPSEKQRHWIIKLAGDCGAAAAPAPAKPVLAGAGLDRVRGLLLTAKARGAKGFIRLESIALSLAPDHGQNPGAVYVKTRGGDYLGKIDTAGRWSKSRDLHDDTAIVSTMQALAADPAAIGAAHGRKTGECCFCGRRLVDPRSVAVGYGPICAEHYGLPHGEVTVDTAVKVTGVDSTL